MNKTMKTLILLAILATAAFGQTVTFSTTTLSSAVTAPTSIAPSPYTVNISTTGMLSNGPNGQVNTVLYVDRELMYVITVVDTTHATVKRGAGTGAGAIATAHASGALVYYAATQTLSGTVIPATRFVKLEQPNAEVSGTCTASTLLQLPVIYSYSGNIYTCANGSSGGQWINISKGTTGVAGDALTAYCTTTVGSAETDFLNNLACSGATSSLPRIVVTHYGTLYGLTGTSSANFLGTGGSVLTVLVNAVATAIVCAPTAATKTCSDFGHSVAVKPGDLVTFSFLSSTSDTAANLVASVGIY